MAAEPTEKILAQESGHLGHIQPDFQIAKTTRPTIESARMPITTRAHRAPRMRKTLAMAPNRYTGMAIGCIPKSDDMSCPVVNFHNQRTRMKEKSANHRMPSRRCVFINAKSPNARGERRGRPSASELATDVARPRSLDRFCSAYLIRDRPSRTAPKLRRINYSFSVYSRPPWSPIISHLPSCLTRMSVQRPRVLFSLPSESLTIRCQW